MTTAPRWGGRADRRARARFIAATPAVCWLCTEPVDVTLPGTHPRGPSVDHLHPRSSGVDPRDPATWRLAHMACNSARGANPVDVTAGWSRRW